MTEKELATNADTLTHIQKVRNYLNLFVTELLQRGEIHDQSKLVEPELSYMVEFTPKLKGTTFGSQEYLANKQAMKPALDHHYANNRHHPEHFPNGVTGMTLLDLVEMFCDWKASSERHNDGNLRRSIVLNSANYGITQQLTQILINTMEQVSC